MAVVLPLLLLLLMGPAGLVIGLLVGVLSDEVLYSVLVVQASKALIQGKPFRIFPGLPELCIAELGLILIAGQNHEATIFQRYLLGRDWLESTTNRRVGRRFKAQLARIWTGINKVSSVADVNFLIGRITLEAGADRRYEFFGVLARSCALDPDGTDSDDQNFLYKMALAMDLPVLAFHQSLIGNYCLNREACAILGIELRSDREALMQAARRLLGPESISAEALIRRQAFALIEDQLDSLERTAERYRKATLREKQ